MWFAATYGDPKTRGGGSNVPAWTRDGSILFPRRLPGSKVPWEYQPQRPDVDHFNRDFKPELARGGTEICRLDPRDGRVTRPHAERSAGLGFPRERIARRQARGLLSGEDGRSAGDLGDGCRRQEPSAHHPRDRRSRCGSPALDLSVVRIGIQGASTRGSATRAAAKKIERTASGASQV